MAASRSSLIVLGIGFGGVVLMALLVKFAFDTNPVLGKLTHAREAFAEEYGDRGLTEISVRSLEQQRGFLVGATFAAVAAEDADLLAEDVARFFVRSFQGRRGKQLVVELRQGSSSGCQGERTVHEQEFSVPALITRMNLETGLRALEGKPAAAGFEITAIDLLDLQTAAVELAPVQGEVDLDVVDQAWPQLERFLHRTLERLPVRRLRLVVRSSPGSGTILKEVDLDKPLRPPARPHPGSSPRPGQR